jgi:ribosomal protein L11 methyltransferase
LGEASAPGPDERRVWAALVINAARTGQEDLVAAVLDDFSPAAIEDLTPQPLPPDGLWDPTVPPVPDPPPSPLHWRVFFQTDHERSRAAAALARFPELTVERVNVADEDWAARSQASLTAVRAGAFVVAPPWDIPEDPDRALTTIIIEPSRGFGTGHHASTRLCLRAMSAIELRGKRVLDLGTGSGVLAIAAALKEAHDVRALDIDPDAIEAARASAALNPLRVTIVFAVGDFRDDTGELASFADAPETAQHPRTQEGLKASRYDVVLANLTGGMLVQSSARIAELVAPGGVLVISGFDESEGAVVRSAFASMQEAASYAEEGWLGLALRSQP